MSNTNEVITMSENRFSFKKGWDQIRRIDIIAARAEIMTELGLTHIAGFYKRLHGEVIPKVTEVEAIERIFKKYKITKIWGE